MPSVIGSEKSAFDITNVTQFSLGNIALLTVVLISARFLYSTIKNVYFHPLSSYPGPKSWAATQFPWVLNATKGNLMHRLLELHRQYGPVVRITPNELSFTDAVAWKDVWTYRKGHDEFPKNTLVVPPNGVWGILGANRMDHRRFRKLLSSSFSERSMREQQPLIMGHVDKLIEGLRSKVGQESQDLVQWFNWTTFDVIGELGFGESFGCLENIRTHPWIAAVFGNLKAGLYMNGMMRFGLGWIAPFIVSKKALALRMMNQEYSTEKIKKRVAMGGQRGDFWDSVLARDEKEGGMSLKEMETNAANIVLGGSETTATLLSGCLYLLLRHPEIKKKVIDELHANFTSENEIDLFTVSQLHYTLAVLDETMRIYPPVPSQAGRKVPPGGDTIDGKFLPAGTVINLPQYPSYHYEHNFTRPEEFIPDRFLGAEEFKNDNYEVLQPFSVGPRNCIGKNLAYAEMRLVLAKVLWNFDFELDDRTGDWLKQKVFILWEKHPLLVKVKERVR